MEENDLFGVFKKTKTETAQWQQVAATPVFCAGVEKVHLLMCVILRLKIRFMYWAPFFERPALQPRAPLPHVCARGSSSAPARARKPRPRSLLQIALALVRHDM